MILLHYKMYEMYAAMNDVYDILYFRLVHPPAVAMVQTKVRPIYF